MRGKINITTASLTKGLTKGIFQVYNHTGNAASGLGNVYIEDAIYELNPTYINGIKFYRIKGAVFNRTGNGMQLGVLDSSFPANYLRDGTNIGYIKDGHFNVADDSTKQKYFKYLLDTGTYNDLGTPVAANTSIQVSATPIWSNRNIAIAATIIIISGFIYYKKKHGKET